LYSLNEEIAAEREAATDSLLSQASYGSNSIEAQASYNQPT